MSLESPSFKQVVAEYLNDTDVAHGKHRTTAFIIVLLVILSVVLLVVETQAEVYRKHQEFFQVLEFFFMACFTIEYVLRIWSATHGKGWKGAWEYMTSFYGVIDLIAIVPSYVMFFVPSVHLGYLRIFRLLRILLLARYMKSFSMIKRVTLDKKSEVLVALQIVAVVTVILSVVMYEIEHAVQPKNFPDIPTALSWSIAKFIHDVGGYGDFHPITFPGQVLATLIGLLGIAVFAIPAGIIASGLTHEMEEEKTKKKLVDKRKRLEEAFREVYNEHLGCELPRKYITMVQAKSRLNYSEGDIIAVAEKYRGLRLKYKRVNKEDHYPSALIIEHFDVAGGSERPYGTCRPGENPSLTIVCPTSYDEASIGHFSLCLARLLKAGYISNELFGSDDGVDVDKACSFSTNKAFVNEAGEATARPELAGFLRDIRSHVGRGTLVLVVRSTASPQVPQHNLSADVQIRFLFESNGIHVNGNGHDRHEQIRTTLQGSGIANLVVSSVPHHSNDLHWYIQKNTGATVISLYVPTDLLEWQSLEVYYDAIGKLEKQVRQLAANQEETQLQRQISRDGKVVEEQKS